MHAKAQLLCSSYYRLQHLNSSGYEELLMLAAVDGSSAGYPMHQSEVWRNAHSKQRATWCICAELVTSCCLLCLLLQALTPLTIGRGRAAASALGALWGFGHSTGQLILGLVFVLLKVSWGAWY